MVDPNPYSLVEIWLEHCREAKHVPMAEAMERGEKPNPNKHATFAFSLDRQGINCCATKCNWSYRTNQSGNAATELLIIVAAAVAIAAVAVATVAYPALTLLGTLAQTLSF
jgi:hypothetical protein